ncbi:MAG: hypothetical protein J4428_04015 [Candidatus Aenigmarchaeota archaeon]|nr:hypothetical protein [Candidatus Aenigmarchaeota archaeon]
MSFILICREITEAYNQVGISPDGKFHLDVYRLLKGYARELYSGFPPSDMDLKSGVEQCPGNAPAYLVYD